MVKFGTVDFGKYYCKSVVKSAKLARLGPTFQQENNGSHAAEESRPMHVPHMVMSLKLFPRLCSI